MLSRLTLVGYRASGKSTIGRLAAARLAWPFVDVDHVIEERLGMPIAQFFKIQGEPAFREIEAAALADTLRVEGPLVVATGGGAILRPANRQLMRERGGLVLYLEVPVAVIQSRLSHHHGGRPSLSGGSVVDEVPGILAVRDPLYREVASVVLPSLASPAETAEQVADVVTERLFAPE